jgi:hypothetical protein
MKKNVTFSEYWILGHFIMFFVVYYNILSVPFNLDNFYILHLQGGQLATRGRCHDVAWTVTGNGKLGPHLPHTGRI